MQVKPSFAIDTMSQVERDFMNNVDKLVLSASPEVLARLAEIDKKTQLEGKTFYDIYSTLSDEEKRKLPLH